ncbi:hypothetical protein Hanom_Chr10g00898431 [Helianthus anomalus]
MLQESVPTLPIMTTRTPCQLPHPLPSMLPHFLLSTITSLIQYQLLLIYLPLHHPSHSPPPAIFVPPRLATDALRTDLPIIFQHEIPAPRPGEGTSNLD